MEVLSSQLLIILNDEEIDSTGSHIARTMLEHIDELKDLSISEVADLCSVSKSTLSKFIRHMGYDDYAAFRANLPNRYTDREKELISPSVLKYMKKNAAYYNFNYDVLQNMEKNGRASLIYAIEEDIRLTYEHMDWGNVNRLVKDLYDYDRIGVFGVMFSETAALDFQTKLAHVHKLVISNMSDLKQDLFIRSAGKDTLLIIFSNSGEYMDYYKHSSNVGKDNPFLHTEAKVVLITANKEMIHDPRVSYCILYEQAHSIGTHRQVYSVLTDLITYQYYQYVVSKNRNQ